MSSKDKIAQRIMDLAEEARDMPDSSSTAYANMAEIARLAVAALERITVAQIERREEQILARK